MHLQISEKLKIYKTINKHISCGRINNKVGYATLTGRRISMALS